MFKPYDVDLHTHTLRSDGKLEPQTLIDLAYDAGIRILALTDHNFVHDLSGYQIPDGMTLLQGCEFSSTHHPGDGIMREVHIIGLGFQPDHPAIREIIRRNKSLDRRPYVTAILNKLRENGINLGTYEDLSARFPGVRLGRMNVALAMVQEGYAASKTEAFDLYIGDYGERRAYTPAMLEYCPMEEVVQAILAAGGCAILCHPFSYRLSEQDLNGLIFKFADHAGDRGAMEVYYRRYDAAQRLALLRLSQKYRLMPSCASDFHSPDEDDLHSRFSCSACEALLTKLGIPVEPEPDILVLSGNSGVGKSTIIQLLVNNRRTLKGNPIRAITPGRLHQADTSSIPLMEMDLNDLIKLLTSGRVDPQKVHSLFLWASPELLYQRLKNRGNASEEEIQHRIAVAYQETAQAEELCDNWVLALASETPEMVEEQVYDGLSCLLEPQDDFFIYTPRGQQLMRELEEIVDRIYESNDPS